MKHKNLFPYLCRHQDSSLAQTASFENPTFELVESLELRWSLDTLKIWLKLSYLWLYWLNRLDFVIRVALRWCLASLLITSVNEGHVILKLFIQIFLTLWLLLFKLLVCFTWATKRLSGVLNDSFFNHHVMRAIHHRNSKNLMVNSKAIWLQTIYSLCD